ncbi:MAG: mitochondrial fission ELM1 family protein [Rhodospirillales bacterium]|jgi:hypothetical protein|nr:mitochondrial fission ELM1 family protein [Rhodospirillales bacterium]
MSEATAQPSATWALLDERAGNRAQCLGIARALGFLFEARELEYTRAAAVPNPLLGASFRGLSKRARARLKPPWPELVIAAGRRTAPVARAIRRASGAFIVQIMFPGVAGSDDFSLIAVPRHDRIRERANVIRMTGAPHELTRAGLEEAAQRWRARLEHLPRPRIALIVGGSTRRRTFSPDMAAELGGLSATMARESGGSLMVTTSRRTGRAAAALIEACDAPRHVHRWGDSGENPYVAYLGLADAVVVTGDSVSMCSEACVAPAPVYIYAPATVITPKHARFHAELFERGYARPLTDRLEHWSHAPLDAAGEVAAEIKRRLSAWRQAR